MTKMAAKCVLPAASVIWTVWWEKGLEIIFIAGNHLNLRRCTAQQGQNAFKSEDQPARKNTKKNFESLLVH